MSMTREDEVYEATQQVRSSASAEKEWNNALIYSEKRKPTRQQYASPPSTQRTKKFEFDQYLNGLDRSTRETILGKREYFFREISKDTRELIQMDVEASYSVTEMRLAEQTSEMILNTLSGHGMAQPSSATITDATACIGGNTANFSKHFAHVNAVELDSTRFEMLLNNTKLLCPDNVKAYHGDYTSAELQDKVTQDVVFFDPPWGGVDYKQRNRPVELFLSGKTLADVCRGMQGRARFVVLKLPFNFAFRDFLLACSEGGALREVAREEMGRLPNRPPKFVIMILKVATPARTVSVPSASFHSRAAMRGGMKRACEDVGPEKEEEGVAEEAQQHKIQHCRLQDRED